MKVREAMTPHVNVVAAGATAREAALEMKELQVGALPVVGPDRRLVGIVTERDLTMRLVAEGRDPAATRVADVMTPGIFYCFEDEEVSAAAKRMAEHRVRRLAVVDRRQRLVGFITTEDLALLIIGEHEAERLRR